jgi:hypothetical protein
MPVIDMISERIEAYNAHRIVQVFVVSLPLCHRSPLRKIDKGITETRAVIAEL